MNEESIYNLVPRDFEYQSNTKSKSYLSKPHSKSTDDFYLNSNNKGAYKTMGPSKVDTRAPDHFLRSHEREPTLPKRKSFKYPDADSRKPAVPKPEDRPVFGLRSNKDFITTNAVENIHSQARRPEPAIIDSSSGHKQLLEPSGLYPVYTQKKEYGKTPQYLEKRKEEIRQAQEEYDMYIKSQMKRGAMRKLLEEERNAIIDGLKRNWDATYKEYLTLPVVIDTPPKKHYKEQMEAEMQQLEKDVRMLEAHKVIYVAD